MTDNIPREIHSDAEAIKMGMDLAARTLLALKEHGYIDGFTIAVVKPGDEHDVVSCCAHHLVSMLDPELSSESTDPKVQAMLALRAIDAIEELTQGPDRTVQESAYAEFRDVTVNGSGFSLRDLLGGFHGLDGGDELGSDSYTRRFNESNRRPGQDMEGGYN